MSMNVAEPIYEDNIQERLHMYPLMRYMGSKHKLVPWIHEVLKDLDFQTVLDGFSGSGVVSYLFKSMSKQVYSNDFLHFSSLISRGLIENPSQVLNKKDIDLLCDEDVLSQNFIADTFKGVFYSKPELVFLDKVSANISKLHSKYKRAVAYAALFRACIKKQPRGVFTVSGNLERYNDGRRDLQLSLAEHFVEQIAVYNNLVFDNGRNSVSFNQDIFDFDTGLYHADLVYLDPPYVPNSDDNCYIKRYHFLEGLSKYWEGEEIMENTKVKKIHKKFTPFSYRRTAPDAFKAMFKKFGESTIVLSYSSNAYPDLKTLVSLLKHVKRSITVHEKPHRYHFGNHSGVQRALVNEYLVIGQ